MSTAASNHRVEFVLQAGEALTLDRPVKSIEVDRGNLTYTRSTGTSAAEEGARIFAPPTPTTITATSSVAFTVNYAEAKR